MSKRRMKIWLIAAIWLCASLPSMVRAAPTMDQITQSFNQNMDQEPDYSKMIPWIFGLAGAVLVVVYFRQRQKQAANPKALNHPGKLLREVAKIAEINAEELRRLKAVAVEKELTSPLVLLLCPSLMEKPEEKSVGPEQS